LPEGNVVVQALDASGNVLAEQPTTLQGSNVGSGGEGTWSVQLTVGAPPDTVGQIVAFSPSPLTGMDVARTEIQVTFRGEEEEEEGGQLEGVYWVLGNSLPDTELSILFRNGVLAGTAGCNSYSGAYSIDEGNALQIEQLRATQMYCSEELMDQEETFLSALQNVSKYHLEDDVLTLYYPGGALVFVASPAP
jgi:heat shock protein HslJ